MESFLAMLRSLQSDGFLYAGSSTSCEARVARGHWQELPNLYPNMDSQARPSQPGPYRCLRERHLLAETRSFCPYPVEVPVH